MKDFLGKELQVGDRVVYGSLIGRSAAIGVGKIIKLKPRSADTNPWRNVGQVYIEPERVPFDEIQEGIMEHKPRWFAFPERMLKIGPIG